MMIRKYCFSVLTLVLLLSGFALAETEAVWIDVRSYPEHLVDSIKGDIRISHGDIVKEVTSLYPQRDTKIRLYCRSGNRAGIALEQLKKAGYTDVSNAGGIDDARALRQLKD